MGEQQTDIVERLRNWDCDPEEAAAEITRLRERLKIATEALKEYRKLERLSIAIGNDQGLPELKIAHTALDQMKGGE